MDFHFGIEINDYWWVWIHGNIGRYCVAFRLRHWPIVSVWKSDWDYLLNKPESQ